MLDHKPLEGLLGENKPISGTSIAPMQRWAVMLLAYDYQFKYRAGVKHGNADVLSRLHLKSGNGENIDPDNTPFENIRLLELDNMLINAEDLCRTSKKRSCVEECAESAQILGWGLKRILHLNLFI